MRSRRLKNGANCLGLVILWLVRFSSDDQDTLLPNVHRFRMWMYIQARAAWLSILVLPEEVKQVNNNIRQINDLLRSPSYHACHCSWPPQPMLSDEEVNIFRPPKLAPLEIREG